MSINTEHAALLKLVEEYVVEYDYYMANGVKVAGTRASKKLSDIKKQIKLTKDTLMAHRNASNPPKKATASSTAATTGDGKQSQAKRGSTGRRESSAKKKQSTKKAK